MKKSNLAGKTINELTITKEIGRTKKGEVIWEFICPICRGKGKATTTEIKSGVRKSCGCLRRKNGSEFFKKYNTTHGESRTSLYSRWNSMISRTKNQNDPSYKQYGARGIKVCEEWEIYENFKEWALKNGYSQELTLERKDNNAGYNPDNCIWADWDTQNNNKQQSRKEEYKGQIKTVRQWAEIYNICYSTLLGRLNRGMTIKEAIETPILRKRAGFKPHNGKKHKHCP